METSLGNEVGETHCEYVLSRVYVCVWEKWWWWRRDTNAARSRAKLSEGKLLAAAAWWGISAVLQASSRASLTQAKREVSDYLYIIPYRHYASSHVRFM